MKGDCDLVKCGQSEVNWNEVLMGTRLSPTMTLVGDADLCCGKSILAGLPAEP
jgi:hypothetical protein